MGVEHTAVAEAVLKVIQKDLGMEMKDVIAFVSDSASVLKAAFDHQLKSVFKNARWVQCLSHGINNIAKVVMSDVDPELIRIFEIGPSFM